MTELREQFALLLIGKPGSGKSSVAAKLQEKKDIAIIGTGNLLREEAVANSNLSEKIQTLLDKGKFVPTEIVIEVLLKEIKNKNNEIILFDGFPRIAEQVEPFFNICEKTKIKLLAVIVLDISRETSVKRLSGRRVCPECNEIYNIYFNPPPENNKCRCGSIPETRDDDKPEVVEKRLDVYEKNTLPIIKYFKENFSEKIFFISGERSIKETAEEIITKIDQLLSIK